MIKQEKNINVEAKWFPPRITIYSVTEDELEYLTTMNREERIFWSLFILFVTLITSNFPVVVKYVFGGLSLLFLILFLIANSERIRKRNQIKHQPRHRES